VVELNGKLQLSHGQWLLPYFWCFFNALYKENPEPEVEFASRLATHKWNLDTLKSALGHCLANHSPPSQTFIS